MSEPLWPALIASLALSPPLAWAEEDEEEPPPQTTVVVASALEEDPFDSMRAVEALDEDELVRRRPRTVPEALMEVPGAYVQKTNHAGGSPIVRGMVGPQNLILIDGVRVNAGTYRTGPLQYLNTIDGFSLQRIELLRGPGSVLYGSDAVGGVFEIVTRDPVPPDPGQTGRFVPQVAVRTCTADWERSGRAGLSVATPGFGLVGGVTGRVFDDLRGGGDVGDQVFTGYSEADWDAKVRVGAPGGDRLEILYQGVRVRDAGRTDKLESRGVLTLYDENHRDLVYLSGKLRIPSLKTRVTVTPSYQRQLESKRTIQFEDEAHEQISWVARNQDVVHTFGGAMRFDTRLLARRLDLVYGARFYRDAVTSEASAGTSDDTQEPATPGYPAGSGYSTSGLYALITSTPVRTDQWVELVVYGGAQLATFSAWAPGIEDVGDVDFHNIGAAGAAGVHLRRRGRFNVGFGFNQGLRAPNLNEAALVGSTGEWFQVPNPDLGPERSDSLEFTGRFRTGPVALAVTGYASFLREYIVRVGTTHQGSDTFMELPVVHNTNQGRGQIFGAEGRIEAQLPAHLVVGGDLTYTWGRYEDAALGWVPVSRIPPLFGTVRVRFSPPWRDLFVDLYAQAAARQDRLSPLDETDARIPEGGTPGWWTLNLRAGFRPHHSVHLAIGATNLNDAAYKYHGSGVYAPGRAVWLAIEFTG